MISIIVPAYNVAPYIRRTLDSILAQTLTELEVIAVNDGSTDETGAVLEEYAAKDARVRPIHQANAGVTAARLAGIAAAKGAWIGFVDGDDYIEPDMYAQLMRNAETYHTDISHCGYRMAFADGRVNYFHNSGITKLQDTQTALLDLLEGTLVEPGLSNKLYRRELFEDLAVDQSIRINEDLLMNYHLFVRAKSSIFHDICPYHYLVRSSSVSRSPLNLNRIWDPIRVKEQILNLEIPGMEDAARRAYLSTCINVYNGLMLDTTKSFKTEAPMIRDLLKTHKSWIGLLSKKQQLLARLILAVPSLYQYLYRFYARFILKNPYQ